MIWYLLLNLFGVYTQEPNQTTFRAIYNMEYKYNDTASAYQEKQILNVFEDGSSKFEGYLGYVCSQKALGRKALYFPEPKKSEPQIKEGKGAYIFTPLGPYVAESYFFNKTIDSSFILTTYGQISKNSLLPNEMINWSISNENKMINSRNCIKAIGKYAGRKYIAWFDPSIKSDSGPWMLKGLPGLIIEASDEHKILKYSLIEYQDINEKELFMEFIDPANNLNITENKYEIQNYKSGFKKNKIDENYTILFTKDFINYTNLDKLPDNYQKYIIHSDKIIQNPIRLE